MTELHELSVSQASAAIASGALSPLELTRALLARINTLDPQINAFICVTAEHALEQARKAEQAAVTGNLRGPLHGIPYGLKDIFDTAGIPTTGHSRVFQQRVPEQDAHVTARLSAAGAILLGKLSTHEMAHGGPSFDLPWPPARNPWHTDYFTGGSSSGSAAAVAARMLPAALGSDTGGSIRGPASLCGITGFMPSAGLISRHGVISNSITLDRCGPMARSAEDCTMLMDALAGRDPHDPTTQSAPDIDFMSALVPHLKGMRIGVLRTYWEEDTTQSSAVIAVMEEALDVLRRLGATLEDTRWLPLRAALDVKIGIGEPEIFAVHAQALRRQPDAFGTDFLQRVLPACLFNALDYVNARALHQRLAAEAMNAFQHYDVLVTLCQGPAPRLAAHRPLGFWQNLNTYAPANISGSPALSVCNGFVEGLPIGMQIIGRPYGDIDVLRTGYAYQQATGWHTHSPDMDGTQQTPRPICAERPAQPDEHIDPAHLQLSEHALRLAGIPVTDTTLQPVARAAPAVLAMANRLSPQAAGRSGAASPVFS